MLAAGTAVGEIEHTRNGVQTAAEQLTLRNPRRLDSLWGFPLSVHWDCPGLQSKPLSSPFLQFPSLHGSFTLV